MQDTCAEYMVKHRNSVFDIIFQFLLVILAAALALFVVIFVKGIGALLAVLIIYGAYYLITSRFLEYEYIFTNGDLDVDKIINRQKRQRLITVKAEEIEKFSVYKPEEHINGNYQTKIFAVKEDKNPNNMCLVVRSKKKGKTLIVFSPNEKISDAIKKFAPKSVM